MASEEWRVLSRLELLDGSPWLRVWAETVELPGGRVVDGFYSLETSDYAVVFATAGEQVVVQRGYKHGPRRVALHLPSGYVEPDEDPLDAAKRELREETGYEAERWTQLGTFTSDGNRGAGRAHLFRAEGARKVAEPASDDLEEAETLLFTRAELLAALGRGEVAVLSSAATIALAAGPPTS
jgi:ADP-ribose pyrophosphatase